jgi:hypothetical protein
MFIQSGSTATLVAAPYSIPLSLPVLSGCGVCHWGATILGSHGASQEGRRAH